MKHSYIDQYSYLSSPLHRLDPRIKIVIFFAFILFIVFTRPTAYLAFFLYGVVLLTLTALSKIPWCFVFKRSLTIIPFVLMIAIFIPFLKKGEAAGGYSIGSIKLTVTYGGLTIFWNVLAKSYLAILCVILLVSSTQFANLLMALEKLMMPKIFTMIMSFMYRYLFIVMDELMEMKRAKESRSAGGSGWFHTKALANMLGVLFVKAYERGESVYLAMCARGFQGTIKTINQFKINKLDIAFFIAIISIISAIKAFAG